MLVALFAFLLLLLSLLYGCSSKAQFWISPKLFKNLLPRSIREIRFDSIGNLFPSFFRKNCLYKTTKSVSLDPVYDQSSMDVQIISNSNDSEEKEDIAFSEVSAASSSWTPRRGFEQVLNQLRREKTNGSRHRRSLRSMKKSVNFVPHATVYLIRHLNEYTKEEINRMWYSEQEWKHLKQDLYAIVAMLSDKSIESVEERCGAFRGLESRTPQGHQRRKHNRAWAMAAVLEEQETQWNCDHEDPSALAAVYHEFSQPCVDAARTLGLEDELQAKLVYIADADTLLDLHHQKPKQSCVTWKATIDCSLPTMSATRMSRKTSPWGARWRP